MSSATIESGMPVHPVCEIVPLMDEEALTRLVDDIRENGLRVPLWTHNGMLVDGRNRLIACKRAGVKPRFQEWDGQGSLVKFAWSLNGARRDLTPGQRAAAAVLMLPILEQEAAERQAAGQKHGGETGGRGRAKSNSSPQKVGGSYPDRHAGEAVAEAAKMTGANRHYVAEAKRLKKEAPKEFEQMKAGKTTIAKAIQKRREDRQAEGKVRARRVDKELDAINAARVQKRFLEKHIGYIDICIKACAKKKGPITLKEIAALTGLSAHNIENNSIEQYWALCPWVKITPYTKDELMFEEDPYLRAVVEGRGPKVTAKLKDVLTALGNLRKMIDREREEARATRDASKWNPLKVRSAELQLLVDHIEDGLDNMGQL